MPRTRSALDHQPLAAPAVGGEPAVQAEDDRGDAVREPHGDHPERPADVEREPHQRDVVQRVAELARGDGEVEAAEVGPPQQLARALPAAAALLELARDVEDRIGHRAPSISTGTTTRRVTATRALTGDDLSLEDVWAVAVEGAPAAPLSDDARERMRAAREVVERVAHGAHEHTYGVNTGFGRFVSKQIPEELTEELQLRLLRSHACGVGDPYPDAVVRAAMLLRANALAKGNSGARVETVELLLECLNRGVLPYVPARGSVGASGDLAPLAHLALPLVGEGRAWFDGELARRRRGARARRARAGAPRREGRAVADQRHAVHGGAGRARARSRAAARARRRLRVRALARGAAGLAQLVHPAGARAAPAARPGGVGAQRDAAARGLGDHRVAPLVRQGAGRLLAALRAAGARRVARPARLRRVHGRRPS